MLQHLPSSVGHALRGVRPGLEKIVLHSEDARTTGPALQVTSAAFTDGEAMPARFTADGAKLSPPIQWSGAPANTRSVVVLIEGADSPTPQPLVHAIMWNLAGQDGALAEGAMDAVPHISKRSDLGRNSSLQHGYLPPDPPPGHGPHRYAIQVFALDRDPDIDGAPGRHKLHEVLRGHVLASGLLVGTYERVSAS